MLLKGLFIIQLVWISCMAIPCTEVTKKNVFVCDDKDLTIVNIYGVDIKCPDTTLCNMYMQYDIVSICNPCYPIAKMCGDDVYKCINDTSFTIGNMNLACPDDHICNRNKKDTCAPCFPYCNPNAWICYDDEKKVTIGGMDFECKNGTVCNWEKQPPCTPCISKLARNSSTFLRDIPEWNINDVL